MSTGLELIPLALAAASAAGLVGARAHRAERRAAAAAAVRTLPTRWRDEGLLVAGLARLGAAPEQHDGAWAGSVSGVGLALTRREDGVYDAHFDARTPVGQAQGLLDALDRAYCVELQRQVRDRVLSHAPQRGMTVVEEHQEDDGTLVLTLELGDAP